ncbi:MAG: hypothetical protein HYZ71_15890 [Deltaproteobacteria bacterium]|nr:hypothetical protein [Deltaproteobacteria bacterium]
MHGENNKRYQWIARSADRWEVIPPLVLFVVIEFFIIFLPTEPIFFAALFVNPKRWLRFSGAMVGGKVIAVAIVYFAMSQIPLERVHAFAADAGMAAVWSRCEVFFARYGAVSLGITALLPLPMFFVTAIAAVSGVGLARLELFAFLGLGVRYAILSWLGVNSRQWVERWVLR